MNGFLSKVASFFFGGSAKRKLLFLLILLIVIADGYYWYQLSLPSSGYVLTRSKKHPLPKLSATREALFHRAQ